MRRWVTADQMSVVNVSRACDSPGSVFDSSVSWESSVRFVLGVSSFVQCCGISVEIGIRHDFVARLGNRNKHLLPQRPRADQKGRAYTSRAIFLSK